MAPELALKGVVRVRGSLGSRPGLQCCRVMLSLAPSLGRASGSVGVRWMEELCLTRGHWG